MYRFRYNPQSPFARLVPSDPGSLGAYEEAEVWKVELRVTVGSGGSGMLCVGPCVLGKISALTLRKLSSDTRRLLMNSWHIPCH